MALRQSQVVPTPNSIRYIPCRLKQSNLLIAKPALESELREAALVALVYSTLPQSRSSPGKEGNWNVLHDGIVEDPEASTLFFRFSR